MIQLTDEGVKYFLHIRFEGGGTHYKFQNRLRIFDEFSYKGKQRKDKLRIISFLKQIVTLLLVLLI